MVTGAYTHAKVNGATIQAAQDTVCRTIEEPGFIVEPMIQPSPLWIVEHEATRQTSGRARSLNAKIYRSPMARPDITLDAKYGMAVKVDPQRKVCYRQFRALIYGH